LTSTVPRGSPAFSWTPTAAPGDRRGLARLRRQAQPWKTALWFTGSVGWLGGARPVDVLDSDPDAVVVAAGRLAAEVLA
jgi:hypothetical protein